MGKFLDRTGIRYGRLLVIALRGKDHRGKYVWACKCDCGNEKDVVGDNLSSGKSKSCGCLKSEFLSKSGNQFGEYKNREFAILKHQYNMIEKRQKYLKKRNKTPNEDLISFESYCDIVKKKCSYCGCEPNRKIKDRLNHNKLMSDTVVTISGVDRVDSNKGYIEGNCVSCCFECNRSKSDMSKKDFLNLIKRIYLYNFK